MGKLIKTAKSALRTLAARNSNIKHLCNSVRTQCGLAHHTLAQVVPQVIQPRARKITIAVTAYCNLRCIGCRYGRDFMPGEQLPLPLVASLLEDAADAGIRTVRLYGGEPLLHRALPEMVRRAVSLGLSTYVTTNGLLLKQKIDALYEAGLRNITIGFYGTATDYDVYVQRDHRYHLLEESVAAVRDRYGSSVSMQLNYLLMRPSCTMQALHNAWNFAERYDLEFTTGSDPLLASLFHGGSKQRTAISGRRSVSHPRLGRRTCQDQGSKSKAREGIRIKHLLYTRLVAEGRADARSVRCA